MHRTCAVTAVVSCATSHVKYQNLIIVPLVGNTTFDGYSESAIKGYIHPFTITCDKGAVNLLESRE